MYTLLNGYYELQADKTAKAELEDAHCCIFAWKHLRHRQLWTISRAQQLMLEPCLNACYICLLVVRIKLSAGVCRALRPI